MPGASQGAALPQGHRAKEWSVPFFMSQHQLLDSLNHRDLRVRTDSAAELGDGVMTTGNVKGGFVSSSTVVHCFRFCQSFGFGF